MAIVTTSINEYGKQNRKVLGYRSTKREAMQLLADYNDNPIMVSKIDITLKQLYDEWSGPKYDAISKSTADNYRAAWNYMEPLYEMQVREIRTANMQTVINETEKSRSTLHKIRVLFGLLMEYAMQNDIVKKDYSEFLTLPGSEDSSKDSFTDIEMGIIERAAAEGVPFADCILMMCYTGFRITEFLQLTKFSYNADDDTLTGGIKTDAGKDRVIPVHSKIKPYLDKWMGKKGQRIICKEDGKPYSSKYFRENCYTPCIESLPVRPLKPHECRHTFASMMDRVAAEDKTKALLMGHSDYKVSRDVYIHKTLPDLRAVIDQMK